MPAFRGERWTQDKQGGPACAKRWGLRLVRSEQGNEVSFDADYICQGWNSGFQGLNLAVLFGCQRIVLLGFDMRPAKGKHHFNGNHPGKLNRASPYALFRAAFEAAAPQLDAAGIEVINCSRQTALKCFERRAIEEVL